MVARVVWRDEKMGGLGLMGVPLLELADGSQHRSGGLCPPETARGLAGGLGVPFVVEQPCKPFEAFLADDYWELRGGNPVAEWVR